MRAMTSNDEGKHISTNDLYSKLLEVITTEAKTTREEIKEEIKTVNTQLCQKIDDQNIKIEYLENKCTKLELKCKHLERYTRKNNIIISGFVYDLNESLTKFTVSKLNELLGTNITNVDINNIYPFKPGTESPIKVEFVRYTTKTSILKNANKLKGTKICISHDLCPEDQEDFKVLRKHLKLAKSKGQFTKIKGQTLIINDEIYTADQLKQMESELTNSLNDLNSADILNQTQTSKQVSRSAPSTPQPNSGNDDVFLEIKDSEEPVVGTKVLDREIGNSPKPSAKKKKNEDRTLSASSYSSNTSTRPIRSTKKINK